MKKTLLAVLATLFTLALAAPAAAQQGVKIVVINTVNFRGQQPPPTPGKFFRPKRRAATVLWDGVPVALLEKPGDRWERFFSYYGVFVPDYFEVVITARICDDITEARVDLFPPDWLFDHELLGNVALTNDFLNKNRDEEALKERLKKAKRILDGKDRGPGHLKQKILGREKMKKDAERWFETVKRAGREKLKFCSGGILTQGITIPVYIYYSQTYVLYVREDRGEYYLEYSR